MKSIPHSKTASALSYLWLAAACLIPISMAAFVVSGYSPVQHLDQWEEMFWLKTYYAGEAHLIDLFRLHNRHPIFVPRLLYLIDIFGFHATNIFLIPMTFLIQASACAILIRETWIEPNLSRPLVRFLAGIYLIFFFSARQYGNFIWGFQAQFILVFAAGVATAACFAKYADIRLSGLTNDSADRKWLIMCLLCATISTFSMANGMLVWPALIMASLISKQRVRDTLVITIVFLALEGFLLALGFRGRAFGAAMSQPVRPFVFLLEYLGSAFSVSLNFAAAAGAVGLLMGAAFCGWYLLRPDRLNRFRLANMIIIIFILLSGVATSIARFAARGATPLSSRYSTPAFIYWACVVSLIFYEAHQHRRLRRIIVPTATCIVLIVSAIFIAPLHLAFEAKAKEAKRIREEAGLALICGVQDERYLGALQPRKTEEVISMVPLLREKRLSMFNYGWAHYIGQNLSALFVHGTSNDCLGHFDAAQRLRGEEGGGRYSVRVFGWAWDMPAQRPCPLVLLVDGKDVVRGIARSGYHHDDLRSQTANESIENSGWMGFATCEKNLPLYAYALSADGSTVCRLPGVYRGAE